MSVEVWKPVAVPAYAAKYEVSTLGRIRNSETRHVLRPMRTGRRRLPSAQRSKVRFSTSPRHDFEVGALVLSTFVSPRPFGAVVMHLNDDSKDNSLKNLKWGTAASNVRDMVLKGRGGCQRLQMKDVVDIRRRRATGERGCDLAIEYGVSKQRICDVYKGRTVLGAVKRQGEQQP